MYTGRVCDILPDEGMQCPVLKRLENIGYAKRMTGFQRLQTRRTSNLTIHTKYSDCNYEG